MTPRSRRTSPHQRGVAGSAAGPGEPILVVEGLAEEIWQRELAVVPGPRISEVLLDQRVPAEAFVQLAREQEPSVGGHRGSSELDAELRIEREANRARCRVTHWVVTSASARNPRKPSFFRVLSDYGLVRSPLKTKMWANWSCVARPGAAPRRWPVGPVLRILKGTPRHPHEPA